jgi:hypothetical protein
VDGRGSDGQYFNGSYMYKMLLQWYCCSQIKLGDVTVSVNVKSLRVEIDNLNNKKNPIMAMQRRNQ